MSSSNTTEIDAFGGTFVAASSGLVKTIRGAVTSSSGASAVEKDHVSAAVRLLPNVSVTAVVTVALYVVSHDSASSGSKVPPVGVAATARQGEGRRNDAREAERHDESRIVLYVLSQSRSLRLFGR